MLQYVGEHVSQRWQAGVTNPSQCYERGDVMRTIQGLAGLMFAVIALFAITLWVVLDASAAHSEGDAANFDLRLAASGLNQPVYLTHAGDGSGRLFVVEKSGAIRIIKQGQLLAQPFLDISDHVGNDGEAGFLSVAFPPDYAASGYFFVYYNHIDKNLRPPEAEDNGRNDGYDTVVARFRVTADPDRADKTSEEWVLTRNQPFTNHNGGLITFGPDGYLYIGLGDGGSAGDPDGNGQDLLVHLGKILRLDTSSGSPYGVPDSNPFIARSSARPEIWAWGLRNPWRFSFDRQTGDLWIADVGQDSVEEVDFQPAGSKGGQNYGWNVVEGSECFKPATGCDTTGMVLPIFEYSHNEGCSITGGYVYRGRAYPALAGAYLFTDYCSGNLWVTRQVAPGEFETEQAGMFRRSVSSFGEDESGELYVTVDPAGAVFRLVAK